MRERLNGKYGRSENDRVRGGSAGVLVLANHPFTFIKRRLTWKQRKLLDCLVEGLNDESTAIALDVSSEHLPIMKKRLDERLGLPYFCEFMMSAPARSLGNGGRNEKTNS